MPPVARIRSSRSTASLRLVAVHEKVGCDAKPRLHLLDTVEADGEPDGEADGVLGAEGYAPLDPDDEIVLLTVDNDLGRSAAWLSSALSRAMDGRDPQQPHPFAGIET